jgi:hypothetical protein
MGCRAKNKVKPTSSMVRICGKRCFKIKRVKERSAGEAAGL